MIDNPKNLDRVKSDIQKVFDGKYEVMDWEELSPELVQSIQIDNASGIIMLGILYIVIAFGIFGTIMMMTAERVKEFGILISVGMKKWKLGLVTLYETLFVSFLGVFTGAIVSIPILLLLQSKSNSTNRRICRSNSCIRDSSQSCLLQFIPECSLHKSGLCWQ